MKITNLLLMAVFLFLFMPAATAKAQTVGKLFTVDHNADSSDANPGDRICADSNGRCTLRAAIQEANSNAAGRDIIIFAMAWPSVIELTNPLTITGTNFSIVGPGARRLAIQRSSAPDAVAFRVFHVPNAGTNVVIRGVTIRNGLAGVLLPGGGIKIGAGSTVLLTEVAILNNSGGTGGGIANDGNLTITRSFIGSNTAGFQGGAIHNSAGAVARITNSTITESSAPSGGAVWNAGNTLLVNNTITHNTASTAASGIFNDSAGQINVLNTIIGNDTSLPVTSLSGAFNSLGNNIVTDARGTTGFTNGVNNDQVSDNNVINPLMGSVADNGGQTDTRALLTGSPAINTGNSCVWNASCSLPIGPTVRLFWDQRRGHLRGGIFDPVDVGAFESGSTSSSGGVLFGTLFPHSPGRLLNSIVIFTDVATNEKTYRIISPFNRFRPPQLGNDVHVMEIRNKRAPALAPSVLAFPD